jgi:hypothetical protein
VQELGLVQHRLAVRLDDVVARLQPDLLGRRLRGDGVDRAAERVMIWLPERDAQKPGLERDRLLRQAVEVVE